MQRFARLRRCRLTALAAFVVLFAIALVAGCSEDPPTAPIDGGTPMGDDVIKDGSRPSGTPYSACDNGGYTAPTTGTIHLGVAIVEMDSATFPAYVDNDFIEGHLFTNSGANVGDCFYEMSYGQLGFTYDMFDRIYLDMEWNGCAGSIHSCAAAETLLARGVDLDDYDMFVFALPNPTGCTNGVGGQWVSSTRSAVSYSAGTPSVYAHEIGHGLGWNHASRGGDGYGDGSCIMGKYNEGINGVWLRHANAPHKDQAGWLSAADIITVDEITSGAVDTIAALTNAPSGQEVAVRIPGETGNDYYLSYRIDSGYDSGLANPDPDDGLVYIDGLTIHSANSFGGTTFEDILSDDESWTAPNNEFRVTQHSVSDTQLLFTVDLPAEHELALDPDPFVSQGYTFNPHKTIDLTVTNLTYHQINVTVAFDADEPTLGFDIDNPVTVAANSYTTVAITPYFTEAPDEGEYTFTVTSLDSSDFLGYTAEVEGSIIIDDTSPTAPGNLDGTASCGAPEVVLTWSASSDGYNGSGVEDYTILRDDVEVGTTTNLTWTDDTGYGESHTYKVYATDYAGNTSSPAQKHVNTPNDTQNPSKPTGITGYAPHQWVTLQWSPSSDDCSGVSYYRIKRGTTVVGTSSSTIFNDGTTAPNTLYTYYVQAVDGVGHESQWSHGYKITTGDELIIGGM